MQFYVWRVWKKTGLRFVLQNNICLWCPSRLVFKTPTWFHFLPHIWINGFPTCMCSYLTIILFSPGRTLSPSSYAHSWHLIPWHVEFLQQVSSVSTHSSFHDDTRLSFAKWKTFCGALHTQSLVRSDSTPSDIISLSWQDALLTPGFSETGKRNPDWFSPRNGKAFECTNACGYT